MDLRSPTMAPYPTCKHYVRQFLSDKRTFAAKYQRVYQAFLRACTIQLDQDQVSRARSRIDEVFTLDDGPVVVAKRLPPKECGYFHPGAARFQWSERQYIYIGLEAIEAYERGTGWIVFEGLLLHECVHWVRFHSGNGDEDGGEWNTSTFERLEDWSEIGDLFNIWAYGFSPCLRDRSGRLRQYGPPDTVPQDDEDPSPVPAWARGWWTV
jgi:hypothetical protein